MIMIEAVIKPNRLDAVKSALVDKGILGATAVEAKRFAKQRVHSERYRGPKLDAGFVPKVLLKVCVKPDDKEVALKTILAAARTGANGEIGDGKVFVYPMAEVYRVRTGESGPAAL
jgi:nitrogen regulatory protein PII